MESELEFDQLILHSTSPDPSPTSSKLKRLKKMNTESSSPNSPKSDDHLFPDSQESDGLDPLFSETVKRVLEFSCPDYDADSLSNKEKDHLPSFDDMSSDKNENHDKIITKKRRSSRDRPVSKPKVSKRKEKYERKAYLAQQADFQRVMRERRCVGFKPVSMVEKPISSVLEKIRKRKLELSEKMMASRAEVHKKSAELILEETDADDDGSMFDYVSAAELSKSEEPVNENSEDISRSSDDQTPSTNVLAEETEKVFRPPLDDTQDLFPDSQISDSQSNPCNAEFDIPIEDVSPTLPSLNLELDSALPDEISSDEEESDKENSDPLLQPLRKEQKSATGDPVKEFLDEEALEDDSDNDINFEDKDEENEVDMEEHCDYIASDFKEKTVDHERRNELHQKWLQQQDEAGTENLLQKLKYSAKQQEPAFVEDEEDDRVEDEDGSDSDDENAKDENPVSSVRMTTKKLQQMIPLMFTDKDDGFVSSDDEDTERSLSRQYFLQKKGLKQQNKKFLSTVEDNWSKEVFGRIKKLNVVPETAKKAKTSSFFDALVSKGSNSDSKKSSFLRRASSNPVPSGRRQGSSTGRSFVFGRDDSRSSTPIIEDSNNLNQSGSHVKKTVSAKFTGSQVKWSTQQTQSQGDESASTSLFDILKRSSQQTGKDNRDDTVDQQAVFAAFKTVKKQIRVVGRS